MDGRNKMKKIQFMLEDIVGSKIEFYKLQKRIMVIIGSSDSCVLETMKLMIKLGLIREVKENVYLIVTDKAEI